MIEVKNVTKAFDGKTVLHDVSCTFETGKTNLIIGQSGSGKTVMMKSIVGLVRPDRGHIYFDGRDRLTMTGKQIKELRKEIGMLFQGSALFDSETVMANVMFPLVMFSDMTHAEMVDRANFCLERVPSICSATSPTRDLTPRRRFLLTNSSATLLTNIISPP